MEAEVASPNDHLLKIINSEVTDFLVILVQNFVFALALKDKQLSRSGKIGKFIHLHVIQFNNIVNCEYRF